MDASGKVKPRTTNPRSRIAEADFCRPPAHVIFRLATSSRFVCYGVVATVDRRDKEGGMCRPLLSFLATTLAVLLLWNTPSAASTITFSGLVGPTNTPLVSYSEAGFTVTGNGFAQVLTFGNPAPDVFGPAGAVSGNITVTRATGGDFTFNSVDLGRPSINTPNYQFEGFLGGIAVFSSGGVLNVTIGTFGNFLSPSAAFIDTLRISYSLQGGVDLSVINVDNVNVSAAVPEPLSLLLLGTGLLGVSARLWRKSRQRR